jgi:CRP-like cAMP-binding protein
MLLTIERVAVLQSVDMFAETPGFVLASIARILHEVTVQPGETFIREGDVEDTMYVIVDGRVEVRRQGTLIITLGPGLTVGELAVLDPEPRSASATALDSTLLFRIDREPFLEAMADRPEIAQAVIRALSRRLREQSRQLANAER